MMVEMSRDYPSERKSPQYTDSHPDWGILCQCCWVNLRDPSTRWQGVHWLSEVPAAGCDRCGLPPHWEGLYVFPDGSTFAPVESWEMSDWAREHRIQPTDWHYEFRPPWRPDGLVEHLKTPPGLEPRIQEQILKHRDNDPWPRFINMRPRKIRLLYYDLVLPPCQNPVVVRPRRNAWSSHCGIPLYSIRMELDRTTLPPRRHGCLYIVDRKAAEAAGRGDFAYLSNPVDEAGERVRFAALTQPFRF